MAKLGEKAGLRFLSFSSFICGSTFYLVLVRKRQPPLSSLGHAPPLSTRKCWKANSFIDLIYTFDRWLVVNQDDAYVS